MTDIYTGCHTHSNAGFYNVITYNGEELFNELSYPLKCGLLQQLWQHLEACFV